MSHDPGQCVICLPSRTPAGWPPKPSLEHVDNVYSGQWNLYSATTVARNVVLTMNWPTSGTHTVRLVVAGTPGHPTVDVDSFLLLG